jgi:membrane protein implicated in regulation of membrane protease activity
MLWTVAMIAIVVVALIAVFAVFAVIAVIAVVVGWRTRGRFSGVPRETGEQRRWRDDGKASYIGHGF